MTLYKKVCRNCGKEYEGQKKSFLCSTACRNAIYAKSDMLEAKRPKVCKHCGKKFMAFRANAKYCSKRCIWSATYNRRMASHKERRPFPKQALWHRRRKEISSESKRVCWLCGKRVKGSFQVHHLDYGDHSPESVRLVLLHPGCHNLIHHTQVCIAEDGTLSFHGKALDLIKEKHMKGTGT
jgi:hypothetical protein